MKVEIKTDGKGRKFAEEYSRRLRQLPEKLVGPASRILLEETQRSIAQNLNKDSRGKLSKSFKVTTGRDWAAVSSDLPYARIHDTGGVIRPKKAQKLTIPIHPMAKGRRASNFKSPNFFRLPGKNVLVFKVGPNELIPLFALADKVTIKATRYLEKARRAARTRINAIVQASLKLTAELARRGAA